jgi:hypothetical protein
MKQNHNKTYDHDVVEARVGRSLSTYINTKFDPTDRSCGPPFFATDEDPTAYQGHLIYQRAGRWDVTKNSICLTRQPSLVAAQQWIDEQEQPDGQKRHP